MSDSESAASTERKEKKTMQHSRSVKKNSEKNVKKTENHMAAMMKTVLL